MLSKEEIKFAIERAAVRPENFADGAIVWDRVCADVMFELNPNFADQQNIVFFVEEEEKQHNELKGLSDDELLMALGL